MYAAIVVFGLLALLLGWSIVALILEEARRKGNRSERPDMEERTHHDP